MAHQMEDSCGSILHCGFDSSLPSLSLKTYLDKAHDLALEINKLRWHIKWRTAVGVSCIRGFDSSLPVIVKALVQAVIIDSAIRISSLSHPVIGVK